MYFSPGPEARSPETSEFHSATEGREVHAFYRANDSNEGFRYAKVARMNPPEPLAGVTAGWLKGTAYEKVENVVSVAGGDRTGTHVRVVFQGPFGDTYGPDVERITNLVPEDLVDYSHGKESTALRPSVQPLLSILCIRWYNYWEHKWLSDYNVTSDQMLTDLFDGPCSVHQVLPGEYEVVTVFVRRTEELEQINELWAHTSLTGQHAVAWYFLWPTLRLPQYEKRAGYVFERDLFSLMDRLERAGIRTGWPHPEYFYKLLSGKLWVPQMCLNSDYSVPPTTLVHFQEYSMSPQESAEKAIRRLNQLNQRIWGNDPFPSDTCHGVIKVGYSWGGKDVLPFEGARGLQRGLQTVFSVEGSQQLLCLVQLIVPDVIFELRAVAFWDAACGEYMVDKVYMRLNDPSEDVESAVSIPGFAKTSNKSWTTDSVRKRFFGGKSQVQGQLEADVDTLVDQWITWVQASCPENPPSLRFDFIVAMPDGGLGSEPPVPWLIEVSECGCALCGLDVAARNAAVLNFSLLHDRSGRFPKMLPERKMR